METADIGIGSALRFIPRLVAENRSYRAIVSVLRDAGLVGGDSRVLRAAVATARAGAQLDVGELRRAVHLLRGASIAPSLTQQQSRYRYHFRMETVDDLTGEEFTRRFSIYTDEILTPEEALKRLLDRIEEATYEGEDVGEEPIIRLVNVTIASDSQILRG